AWANTAKRLSPSPRLLTRAPACRAITAAAKASWRVRAARIVSGCCSQRRVLPSISVKRKVTVPIGRSGIGIKTKAHAPPELETDFHLIEHFTPQQEASPHRGNFDVEAVAR